eukprot:scaffold16934_cov80-Phaeocystis_antarctica.AAC.2
MHMRRGSRTRLRVGHLAQVDDATRKTRLVLANQPLEGAAPSYVQHRCELVTARLRLRLRMRLATTRFGPVLLEQPQNKLERSDAGCTGRCSQQEA